MSVTTANSLPHYVDIKHCYGHRSILHVAGYPALFGVLNGANSNGGPNELVEHWAIALGESGRNPTNVMFLLFFF